MSIVRDHPCHYTLDQRDEIRERLMKIEPSGFTGMVPKGVPISTPKHLEPKWSRRGIAGFYGRYHGTFTLNRSSSRDAKWKHQAYFEDQADPTVAIGTRIVDEDLESISIVIVETGLMIGVST